MNILYYVMTLFYVNTIFCGKKEKEIKKAAKKHQCKKAIEEKGMNPECSMEE